jgi:hypothetical protein
LSVFREGGDGVKTLLALVSLAGVMLLGPASFAANCNDPVPAPTYKLGDRFTWKYANGKVRVWEVTGLDANLAQVKWSDEGMRLGTDNAGTYFLDQDWVIRTGVTKQGKAVLAPKMGAFSMIGKKILDFPLHLGKAWDVTFVDVSPGGSVATNYGHLKVVGCEEVTTPAGKFPALKVEGKVSVWSYNGWEIRNQWYSPDAKNIVKNEFDRRYIPFASPSGPPPPLPDYELMKLELK